MTYQQSEMDFSSNVHANSLEVYRENIIPELSSRENACLDALRILGEATVAEVAKYMNTFHHAISGRFTSLKEKGRVKSIGTKKINNRPHDLLTIVD